MSTVRMCDRCGTIFSERADDWSTYSGSRRRRNKETGQVEVVSDTLDSCPECTAIQFDVKARPEIATTASPRYETDEAKT